MNRNLESIATVAARECVRQQVDEDALIRLLQAHNHAVSRAERVLRPSIYDVLDLGKQVEPITHDLGILRTHPVTFASGGTAVDHTLIADTLERLVDRLDAETDPAEFTKAFLDIHPFRDGNGRTAWLIFNWINGTLNDPLPLPDFYGETDHA
jgi:hypothetical protein